MVVCVFEGVGGGFVLRQKLDRERGLYVERVVRGFVSYTPDINGALWRHTKVELRSALIGTRLWVVGS